MAVEGEAGRGRKMAKMGRKTGVGLQVGLQSGVTFSEKWGCRFGFLGGRIEGEGKG